MEKDETSLNAAQIKGRRLRMLRILSGLTRQELFKKMSISPSTMNTWETGRVELTEVGANRVCMAFTRVGILCTKEWLLNGTGTPPRIMTAIERSIFSESSENLVAPSPVSHEQSIPQNLPIEDDIADELRFFLKIHTNALFHVVEENFMNSRYRTGDCVAGIMEPPESLINCNVIIEKEDGKTTLGKLLTYNNGLCEIFRDMKSVHKIIKSDKTAEVLWHRMISRNRQGKA